MCDKLVVILKLQFSKEMQTLLGVDFGEKKIGLSMARSSIAEPLTVVNSIEEVEKIIKQENVEKIIIGVSEGKSARKAREFGEKLKKVTSAKIIFWDETLSTKEAQALSMEAGISRKKRKIMEDAYAATIILQKYLDIN